MSTVLFLLGLVGLVAYGSLQARSASASASRSFWPNGQPRAVIEFAHGERDGAASAWYEDGRPRFSGTYVEGKRHGEWRFFEPGGELDLERSGIYEDGRRTAPPTAQ